jgi:hypothetical protein
MGECKKRPWHRNFSHCPQAALAFRKQGANTDRLSARKAVAKTQLFSRQLKREQASNANARRWQATAKPDRERQAPAVDASPC